MALQGLAGGPVLAQGSSAGVRPQVTVLLDVSVPRSLPRGEDRSLSINRETSALRAHLPRSPGLGITQQVGLSASLRTFLLGHRAHFRRTGGTCAARSLGRLAEVSLGGPQAQMAPARACR